MEWESKFEEKAAICETYEDFINKIKGMKSGTNMIDNVNNLDKSHLTISDHIGIYQGLMDS